MKIFWAWQFDLPGKIARHFIRNALETAIAQINQTDEIDEPDEAFQDGRFQLDYGRKNLKGSPDLAIEIPAAKAHGGGGQISGAYRRRTGGPGWFVRKNLQVF